MKKLIFLILTSLLAGFFYGYAIKKTEVVTVTDIKYVTVNPTPGTYDYELSSIGTGTISGIVTFKPRPTPNPQTGHTKVGSDQPTPTPVPGQIKPILSQSVVIPVFGIEKNTYTNSKTGKVIGEGEHPLTGETTVNFTFNPNSLSFETITASTRFDDNVRLGIDFEEREVKRKTWQAGLFYGTDQGLFIQKDFVYYDWFAGIRGEVGSDSRVLVVAGKRF